MEDIEKKVSVLEEKVKNNSVSIVELKTISNTNSKALSNLDKSLSITIEQIKNIAEDLKTTSINFKEAIMRSNTANSKETEVLKEKYTELERKYEKLDAKVEQETVVKDAEKWKKMISYVATAILGAVVTFILAKIGLG